MKKAKESGDFLNKAADLLSVFKSLTGNKTSEQPKTEQSVPAQTAVNKPQKNSPDGYPRPQGFPQLVPQETGTNIFRSVIEKHDKSVKKILKEQEKNKDK